MAEQTITCYLCHQTLDIATACADESGHAVHSDCYAKAISEPSSLVNQEKNPSAIIA